MRVITVGQDRSISHMAQGLDKKLCAYLKGREHTTRKIAAICCTNSNLLEFVGNRSQQQNSTSKICLSHFST